MTNPAGYNATLDPRTGRPVLPIDAENIQKADAESLPLTEEDNQGIDIGDENAVDEDHPSHELQADDKENDEESVPSSVDVNSTVPRMKAADPGHDELESDDELLDEDTVEEEIMEGERPEALAKFAEVARNDDGKPVRNGTEATAETAPIPTDPTQKQDAATRVLREGVLKQDQGADEAIDRLPDRADPRDHVSRGQ